MPGMTFLDYAREISDHANNTDIAKAAGVHKSTVGKWDGTLTPTLDAARNLSRAYNIPIIEILIAAGLVTRAEVHALEVRAPLADYSPTVLLQELQRRFDEMSAPAHKLPGDRKDPDPDDYDLAAGTVERPDDQPAD